MSPFADRQVATRAGIALVLANLRFWPTVAAEVGRQLKRWENSARRIKEPSLRTLALQKLRDEHFNSQVAATLATLAPRAHRATVIEAIVAYEVMYDYLDGRTELPSEEPLATGSALYEPFIDAVAAACSPRPVRHNPGAPGDRYVAELASVVQRALVRLPAVSVVREAARGAARRCAEAQVRAHAVPRLGTKQLEDWAGAEAPGAEMPWQQFLAGAAASVLAVHALIAAAADSRTNSKEAGDIDAMYLSICALSTMLDSLVDYDRDLAAGELGYVRYYRSAEALASDLVCSTRRAVIASARLRNGPHHVMTMVGVAAYYLSAPTANSERARPTVTRIARELQPLMTPTLIVMRGWRTAKHLKHANERPTRTPNDPAVLPLQSQPRTPRYVAIIADGNGRWAQAQGLPVIDGHEAGADTLRARIADAIAFGIRELTVYSFSTENWSRPATEVRGLMTMLTHRIASESAALNHQGVRMRFLGRREDLPCPLVKHMLRAEALTSHNAKLELYIAINYGGRAEIIDAAKRFDGHTEDEFRSCLYTPDMHDPDIVIRTGGERRLSNYLLWQIAGSELVFRDELWPDFTQECFRQTLAQFTARDSNRSPASLLARI